MGRIRKRAARKAATPEVDQKIQEEATIDVEAAKPPQSVLGRNATRGILPISHTVVFKAFSIHPIKWSPLYGLLRKPTAPAFMARVRTLSSG